MAVTNTVTGKMNYLTVGSNTYEIEDKNAAPLASPAFTGTPTAPTATAGTSTTQIATTKFVMDAMSGAGAGTVTSVGISNATNGGLSISGSPVTSSGTITIGHSNILTSAQTTQAVYPIKIDKNGHISAYGSAVTIPTKTSDLTNDSGFITSYTDEKLALAEVTSTVQYYPIVGTGTTASTRQCDTTGFIYIGTNGTTSTVGTANLTLGNATASGTVNNKRGQIYLYGTSTGRTRINTNVTSGTSVVSFPDKGGTVALTDDIPTVPTITLNGSSTTSPSFYAPTTAGTDGYYLKSNGSGAPTWAAIQAGGLATSYTSGTISGQANWNNGSLGLIISESTSNYNNGIGINPYGVNLIGMTGSTDSPTAQAMIGVTPDGTINLSVNALETIALTISDGYMSYDINDYHINFPDHASGTIALTSDIPYNRSATATLNSSSWSSNTQTVNVTGVSVANNVIVTYAPASRDAWLAADIYCSAQGAGTLTFTCSTTPTTNITANVLILG